MSGHSISVRDIADAANEAMRETNPRKREDMESDVAEMCEEFMKQREAEWIREVQTYNKWRLRVLYALLPATSKLDEGAQDPYEDARTNLLGRLQKLVSKHPESENWEQDSPKDRYYILNINIGEVRPAALRAA